MKAHWLLCLLLAGCGLVPQRIAISDPVVQALFESAEAFPRGSYGFSSLPTDPETDIRIERHAEGTYNVMLHIYTKTRRTIAFRESDKGYIWIHEQESFPGLNMYDTQDGPSREEITLTYAAEPLSGHAVNRLTISYYGDDERLSRKRDLILSDIEPILNEWGYKK